MYYTLQMYEQLKTAYETEVDMIRDENEKKIRRSIANHALQLQNYRDEVSLKLKYNFDITYPARRTKSKLND